MSQKELQEKMLRYQMLEENFKQLNERREAFTTRLVEIEQTKQAIEELGKTKDADVFVPLGANVFLPGKVDKKEKMIVGIGSDIALEKDVKDVGKILESRKETLEKGLENVQNTMLKVANEMQKLQQEAESLLPKSESAG